MNYIEELKDKYKGSTCAIYGGGTNLPQDIRALPEVDVQIGVNHHALILPLDYIVFIDTAIWPLLKDHCDKFITRSPKINPDDELGKTMFRYRQTLPHNYSGALAIIAADIMGFDKIYVCGIDQYDGGEASRIYWHEGINPQRPKPRKMHDTPKEMHNVVRRCKRPENIYFMSGRLKQLHQ